jgi:hypothetical protein
MCIELTMDGMGSLERLRKLGRIVVRFEQNLVDLGIQLAVRTTLDRYHNCVAINSTVCTIGRYEDRILQEVGLHHSPGVLHHVYLEQSLLLSKYSIVGRSLSR